MDKLWISKQMARIVAAAASALCVSASSLAAGPQANNMWTIMVFDEGYVVAQRFVDDLDVLEAMVNAMQTKAIELDVCGANTTRALKAAVHRFRRLPLEIRVFEAGEQPCLSVLPVARVAHGNSGLRPEGIDDAVVERYWSHLMP